MSGHSTTVPVTLAQMVAVMAKNKIRRGRPKKKPTERLSERRLIRLNPTLDAVVEVLRKQKAEAAQVPVGSIRPQDIVRELMMDGARARGLLPPDPADAGK